MKHLRPLLGTYVGIEVEDLEGTSAASAIAGASLLVAAA